MTIAIPVDENHQLIPHTGRAAGFLVFEVNDSQVSEPRFVKHDSPHHHHQHAQGQGQGANQPLGQGFGQGQGQGNGHHHSHTTMIDNLRGVDVVIALGMGPRLQQDFCTAGIDVMYTRERTVEAIVEKYRKGEFVADPRGSLCKGGQHHH